jgi:hypothetical protein
MELHRVSWLVAVACSSAPAAPPSARQLAPAADPFVAQPDGPIGTPHPVLVEELAVDGSWLVICQARADTNGDGKIEVGVGFHGDMFGDKMSPYLVLGGGPGVAIDSYVTSVDGWVAIVRDGKLEVVDAASHKRVALPGADVRDDNIPFAGSRVAALGGGRMIYFRGDRVILRELASGREHELTVDGTPWRAEIDTHGTWARIAVIPKGQPWPALNTTLAPRGCRGRALAYSTTGDLEGKSTVRWLDVAHAAFVAIGPGDDNFERAMPYRKFVGAGFGFGTKMWCTREGCRGSDDKPIKLPGKLEYAWEDRALLRSGTRWLVFDATTLATHQLDAVGDFDYGDGDVVAIGDRLFRLASHAPIGSSRTDAVLGHAGDRVLLGRTGPPCTSKPGDLPFACVDGVANPAAGGHTALPIGPLRWTR